MDNRTYSNAPDELYPIIPISDDTDNIEVGDKNDQLNQVSTSPASLGSDSEIHISSLLYLDQSCKKSDATQQGSSYIEQEHGPSIVSIPPRPSSSHGGDQTAVATASSSATVTNNVLDSDSNATTAYTAPTCSEPQNAPNGSLQQHVPGPQVNIIGVEVKVDPVLDELFGSPEFRELTKQSLIQLARIRHQSTGNPVYMEFIDHVEAGSVAVINGRFGFVRISGDVEPPTQHEQVNNLPSNNSSNQQKIHYHYPNQVNEGLLSNNAPLTFTCASCKSGSNATEGGTSSSSAPLVTCDLDVPSTKVLQTIACGIDNTNFSRRGMRLLETMLGKDEMQNSKGYQDLNGAIRDTSEGILALMLLNKNRIIRITREYVIATLDGDLSEELIEMKDTVRVKMNKSLIHKSYKCRRERKKAKLSDDNYA